MRRYLEEDFISEEAREFRQTHFILEDKDNPRLVLTRRVILSAKHSRTYVLTLVLS